MATTTKKAPPAKKTAAADKPAAKKTTAAKPVEKKTTTTKPAAKKTTTAKPTAKVSRFFCAGKKGLNMNQNEPEKIVRKCVSLQVEIITRIIVSLKYLKSWD